MAIIHHTLYNSWFPVSSITIFSFSIRIVPGDTEVCKRDSGITVLGVCLVQSTNIRLVTATCCFLLLLLFLYYSCLYSFYTLLWLNYIVAPHAPLYRTGLRGGEGTLLFSVNWKWY